MYRPYVQLGDLLRPSDVAGVQYPVPVGLEQSAGGLTQDMIAIHDQNGAG